MASRAVGIDIGTRTITVAEVREGRTGVVVTNFGGIELPGDVVNGGEVLDPAAAAAALRELLSTAKVKTDRVWLGVANPRVVVRQIDLPYMELEELRTSIRYQAQEHLPIAVEDAELDVYPVEDWFTEEGDHLQRVLLVAAHKEMLTSHVEVATRAGLKPIGIDLNCFAVLRAVGNTSPLEQGSEMVIDIGAGVTSLVIHEAGTPTFVRILATGGDSLTEALARGLDLDRDQAEQQKRQCRLGATDPASQLLTTQVDRFIDEIRSSLDYYAAQPGSRRLSYVVLSGGAAALPGLPERLAASLRLPVDLASPFARTNVKDTVYGEEDLHDVGPTLATAVGLALGGLE
ncbi:type IV pilus assembly protein PilM [Egicoccus sp. AB-alg2]|uniref:type IV pilus assembly protein PilM n=1 Tax=Egicoccus sp. AB-alg2 TaxID=3242693 RepID=UPI00359E83FD